MLSNGTYKADSLDDGASSSELSKLVVEAGTDLRAWMLGLDTFISVESPLLATFALSRSAPSKYAELRKALLNSLLAAAPVSSCT